MQILRRFLLPLELYVLLSSFIFTEIYTGDLRNFVKQILIKIKNIKKNKKSRTVQQKKIKREFSQENEVLHIKKFLRFVK